jgi:predicted RNA-binding Zn ribbon-like protein
VSTAEPPHSLQLVIDFVNTLDLETGADELTTEQALQTWLQQRGLLEASAETAAADLAAALELREALRTAVACHNGATPDAAATAVLERAAEQGQLGVRFAADGSAALRARATGVPGGLARLLAFVARASADGTWTRVKACGADDCRWAFYDHSRNRSGRWCDMAVCGNRHKVRSYRSRQEAG